jgi:hypothetical protein
VERELELNPNGHPAEAEDPDPRRPR